MPAQPASATSGMPPGRFRRPPPLPAATWPLAWPPPTTFNPIDRDRARPVRLPVPIIPRVNATAVSLRWIRANADGRVTDLRLGDNQLSGSIPSELGNLANLEWLYLRDNQFSGCVPVKLLDTGCVAIPFVDVHPQTIAATLAVRSIPEGVTQAVVVILGSYTSHIYGRGRQNVLLNGSSRPRFLPRGFCPSPASTFPLPPLAMLALCTPSSQTPPAGLA